MEAPISMTEWQKKHQILGSPNFHDGVAEKCHKHKEKKERWAKQTRSVLNDKNSFYTQVTECFGHLSLALLCCLSPTHLYHLSLTHLW